MSTEVPNRRTTETPNLSPQETHSLVDPDRKIRFSEKYLNTRGRKFGALFAIAAATGGLVFGGVKTAETVSGNSIENNDENPNVTGPLVGGEGEATIEASAEPTVEASAEPSPVSTEVINEQPVTPEVHPDAREWNITYSEFLNWEQLDEAALLEVTNRFWEQNPARTDVVANPANTGEEIMEYWDAHMKELYALNRDTSNDMNQQVARALATTLVHDRSDTTDYATDRIYTELESQSAFDLEYSSTGSVLRYSDGIEIAQDSTGEPYDYKAIEYIPVFKEEGKPDFMQATQQAAFEWDAESATKWRQVFQVGIDTPVTYGDTPPVVLDPSRADAPWQ